MEHIIEHMEKVEEKNPEEQWLIFFKNQWLIFFKNQWYKNRWLPVNNDKRSAWNWKKRSLSVMRGTVD